MKLPVILTFDNAPALRHAVRGAWQYVCLLVSGLALYLGIYGSSIWGFILSALYLGLAFAAFRGRYTGDLIRQRTDAQNAEHEARMRELKEKQAEAEARVAFEVATGQRCPDDCEGCEAEDVRREREMAEFRAERARRHGHAFQVSDV